MSIIAGRDDGVAYRQPTHHIRYARAIISTLSMPISSSRHDRKHSAFRLVATIEPFSMAFTPNSASAATLFERAQADSSLSMLRAMRRYRRRLDESSARPRVSMLRDAPADRPINQAGRLHKAGGDRPINRAFSLKIMRTPRASGISASCRGDVRNTAGGITQRHDTQFIYYVIEPGDMY